MDKLLGISVVKNAVVVRLSVAGVGVFLILSADSICSRISSGWKSSRSGLGVLIRVSRGNRYESHDICFFGRTALFMVPRRV